MALMYNWSQIPLTTLRLNDDNITLNDDTIRFNRPGLYKIDFIIITFTSNQIKLSNCDWI